MNKRALAMVSGVLLLLLFGTIEARKLKTQQKTVQFRADFWRHAPVGDRGRLAEVSLNGEKACLGLWEGPELRAALEEVELAWDRPQPVEPGTELRSFEIEMGSQWNQDERVELWAGADWGRIYFSPNPDEAAIAWELSPESCRALKRRIWATFGDQLRALPEPPPEPQ